MKRIIGFITICGLVLLGCSHKESQDNGSRHVGEVLAKENEWGESVKIGDFLSVMGTHQLIHKEFELITDAKVLGPNSGADNHAPTNMTFPTSGM
ncbi:hypothetical protein [Lysinibacillus xylanilyticus]|uniref:hypothetical protein n=1 Tax=Lysinibacillus xylanilyticus TaxID=582475 RepID=UPI003D010FC3